MRPPSSLAANTVQRARRAVRRTGYDVVRYQPRDHLAPPPDCDAFTRALLDVVRPYTLTGAERIMALVEAVRYVVRADVPGAIAECGVWRGGSMMVVARTLLDLDATDRDLYMFDTFTHMPDPGEHDRDHRGIPADELLAEAVDTDTYRYLPYEEVRRVIESTGYPTDRLHFVQGLVEDTIPEHAPDDLALCRLDTDWYASTAHEMAHLYPRISRGGVLLVDDYGQFMGARKAVDEYFARQQTPVLLNRIDFTGRLVVKT